MLLIDGAETDIDIQLVGFEQQILHNLARVVGCGLEQDTEREGLMNVCLTDVEDIGVVARQDVGKRRGHTGFIDTRDVDLDDFCLLLHNDW